MQEVITPFTSLDQLPEFKCDERFNVFYLEATLGLLEPLVRGKNHLVQADVFHTALGFQAQGSQIEFELDFVGNNFLGSFLPVEQELQSGNLTWDNGAVVYINSFINRSYWEHSDFMATISLLELYRLSRYILEDWYPSNPFYIFFKAVATATPAAFFNTAFRNTICDTFVTDCLLFLSDTGTPIQFITPVSTAVAAFVTGDNVPTLLDPDNNPHDKARILRFYTLMHHVTNQLTPTLKSQASNTRTSTRRVRGESPTNVQDAVKAALSLVHQNEGHLILYTYIPGTAALGYFLLKLQTPFIYADYILNTQLVRTLPAFDTNNARVPEPF
jgi:hypothetical protein